ncbi:MAG: serine/threonine protein kinase [Labilithrix sp.]|nr:serine/threonine protein kinase [Labilithrix sp.]
MTKDLRPSPTALTVEHGGARAAISGLRPPAGDPIIGRCLGGKLIVEERIGAGALGVVYRAKHVLLPQPVAVKVLHAHYQEDPEFRARFLAEAQAASMLDHPSLVRVLDFGEQWGGFMWLAMELLEGTRLDALLAEEARLPVERAVAILLDVCAGLAHAHARGIVHGDVKPANVLLVARPDDDGDAALRAKLCDFGVARMAMHGDVVESGTRPALGTPAYMSPEQCLGESLDARSDVYSCGVLFYELVTGEVPFDGTEPQALLRQHLLVSPTLPSAKCSLPDERLRPSERLRPWERDDIDARVDAIVTRALAKERDDRFASMRELRAALRELAASLGLEHAPSVLPPPPVPPPPPPPPAVPLPPDTDVDLPRAAIVSEVRALRDPCVPTADLADFLLARGELLDRERHALRELLLWGTTDEIARRVARLVARLEASGGRDTVAADTLSLLDKAANLAPFAERLLSEDVLPGPYVERVLWRSGHACARALWSARIAGGESGPERRGRFVSWMLAIGPGARDVLRAGLVKLAQHAETGRHADVVEDVLLALPTRCDDELLAAAATFAKSPVPRVRELALAAVARSL